ncbi:uncharacterized protein LOC114537839 [Dendronephthya gigantea]|uniref:uncharacterized protein LOC114537839 n=1 Tax=Dendronephthya gigantea TaxID=151771 RepID=UPI001068EC24|nr:uncharacterized protein LOC114537839 [Dendronephthya gigantea]
MHLLEIFVLMTVLLPIVISAEDVDTRKKRSVSYAVEGCYSSFSNVGLRKRMRGHNSNVKCQEVCRDKGYILAATNGDKCLCGNVYPKGKKVADSQCTARCRSWSPCQGPQSCCGGPSAYSVSVVGNIDVAKQVLRRLSHEWQTNKKYRDHMRNFVAIGKIPRKIGNHVEKWKKSFNKKGWSQCGKDRYMTGLYRKKKTKNDPISLLDQAKCSDVPGLLYLTKNDRDCYNHNWKKSFDKKGWSTCKNGYYMTGLWRNSGNKLDKIEQAKCCRPKFQVKKWGHCYNQNVQKSFGSKGWSSCKSRYYMAGLYRSSCNKLSCLVKFKCCKMGAYNENSWVSKPDLVIKVKDTSGQLKQCSINSMDKSADSNTYKCNTISDRSDILALNAASFNIEEKSPLNVAAPQPVKGFRPVICSAHPNPYKCTKWLTTSVSTSSSFKIGSGISVAVKVGASVEVSAGFFGTGAKSTFTTEVTTTASFNVESSKTNTYTTTDKTDVSIEVPKNTEITINLLRTVEDLEYKWNATFELLGKYFAKWSNGKQVSQDVTTVLSGSKRQMYVFGSWNYPSRDVLRVVISDKYGNKKSDGCEHEAGKGENCDL